MTVNYSRAVATIRYGSLARLLLRWKGSVYKAVWPIILAYCIIYVMLAGGYQLISSETATGQNIKRNFVRICKLAGHVIDAVPVSFALGYFVNLVVSRWWNQFLNLPTPDLLATPLAAFVGESDNDKAFDPLVLRRTVTRYLNLGSALCLRDISLSTRSRFPTIQSLIDAGLMTEDELAIHDKLDKGYPQFFIPLTWSVSLLTKAFSTGMIKQVRHLDALIKEVVAYWERLNNLFVYDYVNVPLVYNQVVAWSVYAYLIMLTLSQQFADPVSMLVLPQPSATLNSTNSNVTTGMPSQENPLDVFPNIPISALLTLMFYAGWLRVAEGHLFPFGEEDEDFDIVPLLERNVAIGMWFADTGSTLPDCVLAACDPERSMILVDEKIDDEDSVDAEALASHSQAMGRKRIVSHSTTGATVGASFVSDTLAVPTDLPCPDELRRRDSQYFFRGSIARLHDDASDTQSTNDGSSVHRYQSQPRFSITTPIASAIRLASGRLRSNSTYKPPPSTRL